MIRINQIKIREDLSEEELFNLICKRYEIDNSLIVSWHIFKKSIDARDKNDIHYSYTVDIEIQVEKEKEVYQYLKSKKQNKNLKNIDIVEKNKPLEIKVERKSDIKPIVIGAGPAGLFAGLTLVQNGIKPIIIEQGKSVEERQKDIENFWNSGKLNTMSNVQFGEGGAGTFSDGKLTTGINNPLCSKVIEEFVKFGAPKQISYMSKPHIGTDNLIHIIKNIREFIISKGGEFYFDEKVIDFDIDSSYKVKGVITNKRIIETDSVILAIGHSARDTFEMIYKKGLNMEKKNFSVGVRIEHKQELINKSQYSDKTKLKLPPAEYKLAYHGQDGRSCYTFCMCPGGMVVASSSEERTIVTNGMSKFARDGENANSAVLVNVTPDDFKGESVLEGVYFQKELEEKAFKLGGRNYNAPIQRVEDFLNNKESKFIGKVKPSYKPGVTLANLNTILPEFVNKTLKEGLVYFDKKIKGFADNDAILTGVETRSSSPVKINRNEELQSNVKGIYPCGEGAGYAGGIMSAAVDGIKCAIKLLENE